jgi:glycosyltransferase involved in cell wall biosynthesis
MKRILIFDRLNSKEFPGGDTVQIQAIASYLRGKGHELIITSDLSIDLRDCDIIFIFNLTNPIEAYLQAMLAVKYEKPYILFPVYWNLDQLNIPSWSIGSYFKQKLPSPIKSLFRLLRFSKLHKEMLRKLNVPLFRLYNLAKMNQFTLQHATYICPNSVAEITHLSSQFPIKDMDEKCRIIYNGVDWSAIHSVIEKKPSIKEGLPKEYICCVGGIGPRKNQLNLVKAIEEIPDLHLIIIGRVHKMNDSYYTKVKNAANENVTFMDNVPQNEVFSILMNSLGHIQPSYIETPGLVSMESAALGIPIGVSELPPVMEYFKENANYCKPDDIESIRLCIMKMLSTNRPKIEELQKRITQQFDWSVVLKELDSLLR